MPEMPKLCKLSVSSIKINLFLIDPIIPMMDLQIHEALKDVQQTVVSGDEKLKDAMVPIATLHLTIMVMHLATEEDVERLVHYKLTESVMGQYHNDKQGVELEY